MSVRVVCACDCCVHVNVMWVRVLTVCVDTCVCVSVDTVYEC